MDDTFKNFFDLASHRREGVDYSIITREVSGSNVVIVAPHGEIEPGTIEIAQAVSANDYNLYFFKSLREQELYEAGGKWWELHLTSTRFDEPRCLDLVARTDVTLTIHGSRLEEPVVCLSGRDKKLQSKLVAAFNAASIDARTTGHPYQSGESPENICNKNRRGKGVQLEFSRSICADPVLRDKCIRVVRDCLKNPAMK